MCDILDRIEIAQGDITTFAVDAIVNVRCWSRARCDLCTAEAYILSTLTCMVTLQ